VLSCPGQIQAARDGECFQSVKRRFGGRRVWQPIWQVPGNLVAPKSKKPVETLSVARNSCLDARKVNDCLRVLRLLQGLIPAIDVSRLRLALSEFSGCLSCRYDLSE